VGVPATRAWSAALRGLRWTAQDADRDGAELDPEREDRPDAAVQCLREARPHRVCLDVAEVGGRDGIPTVKASTRGPEPITAWTLESSFGIGNYCGRVMFEDRLEVHRVELTGYCYRMLACGAEAEDAVQETLFRAWKNADRFDEGKACLRTWLHRIATNVCLDMTRSVQRRALAMDLGPSSPAGGFLGAPLTAAAFVQPVPDRRVLSIDGDPAELAVQRETIRLAFVAALQHLPPRQRAVLILREVLCWSAEEVAGLLDTSPAAVNSALQRARATMSARHRPGGTGEVEEDLLGRYVQAFTAYDVDGLVALLHEDATMSMPPFAWWLDGREAIRAALLGAAGMCADDRLVRTAANGSPAFGQYRDGQALGLVVLDVRDGLIAGTTTYLEPSLLALFGLPMNLEPPRRT
jgi:RNA polymerase sigma-70 factor, ECF subfamily